MADPVDEAQARDEALRSSALARHRARPRAAEIAHSVCVSCGEAISPARQAAVPGTRFCIECRAEMERKRR